MLKIVFFSACEGLGRGEVYVDLANALVEFNDLKVGLVAPQNARYLNRLHSEVQIDTYQSWNSRWNPFLLAELKHCFRSLQADVVHTHFGKATEIYARIANAFPSRFLATKHNVRKGKIFEKVAYVSAVSQRAVDSIQRTDVSLIQNAIKPTPHARTRKSDGFFRILSVGRLDPIKGYDRLILALKTLPDHVRLRLLGEGDQRPELEALIRKEGLSDRVTMPGFTESVPEEMANADAFVLSSHSEGNCVALIEALFYAPLAVSTPVGAAEEVLGSDFLVSADTLGDDLKRIIDHYPTLRDQFDTHRKATCPNYQWDNIAGQYRSLYHQMVQDRGTSTPAQ